MNKDFLPPLSTLKFNKKGKVLFHKVDDPTDQMITVTLLLVITPQLPYLYVYVTENPFSVPHIAIELPPLSVQLSQEANGAFIVNTSDQSYIFYTSMLEEATKWVNSISKATLRSLICPRGVLSLVNSPRTLPKVLKTPKRKIPPNEFNGVSLLTSYNNEINPLQRKILRDQLRINATINITGLIQTINERHISINTNQLKQILVVVLFGVEIKTMENAIGEIGLFAEKGIIEEQKEINEIHGSLIFGLKEDSKIPNLHAFARNLDAKQKNHILMSINRIFNQKELHQNNELSLFPGENIISIIPEMVHLHFNKSKTNVQPLFGTLIITTGRFIFKHQKQILEINQYRDFLRTPNHCSGSFNTPLPSIKKIKVKCIELESINKFYTLLIVTKYFNFFYIGYFTDENEALKLQESLFGLIEKNAQIELFSLANSFEDRVKLIRQDYSRMGTDSIDALKIHFEEICPTYPPCIVIPSIFNEEEVQQCVQFRSKGRIPIVSWVFPGKGVLVRSSQPATGIISSRNKTDEQMMIEYSMLSKQHCIKIYDARPKLNASVNRVKGMGSENTKNYTNSSITFLNIDNIHKMRDAEDGIFGIIESPLSEENKKCWLKYIKKIIKGTCDICNSIIDGNSVLIHCSDGWDRTSQLSSLVMIIMDPYYRTMEGFQVLIEKEWSFGGHKFSDRCRHLNGSQSVTETSPIFLQFIDCVYQLYSLFPEEFEFKPTFLKELMFQLYSCYFANFRFNCWKEYNELGSRIMNFYSFIKSDELIINGYINEMYEPKCSILQIEIIRQKQPTFWDDYYADYLFTHSFM